MQAGFYESDITPFYDTRSATAFDYGLKQGVNTPFSFSAGVFESAGRTVALVGADMIILDRALIDFAEAELKKRMPLDCLIAGASHTHANPVSSDWMMMPESEVMEMTDIQPAVRARVAREIGRVDPDYKLLLRKRLVDAVWNAWLRRQPVRLVTGCALVENVAYNRRYKMKNGLTVTHGGKGNPDIVDYAGPADQELAALGAVNAAGEMLGAVVNFACHGTVSAEDRYSADWPYYMRETVKRNIHPRMSVVFLNGCCGDVTQIDNLDPAPEPRTERRALVLGERVGFGAVEALRAPDPESFNELKFRQEILPLTYRAISEARYQSALADLNEKYDLSRDKWRIGYYARDTVLLVNRMRKQPIFDCELNAMQIGNLILFTSPGEVFAQMAVDVKAAAKKKFPCVMVAELTNGHAGYIPTPEAFGPGGGGYEPKFGGGSFLETGAFEKIREKFLGMLAGFQPERAPAKPDKIGKPWMAYQPDEL